MVVDASQYVGALQRLHAQTPFALARALTWTAKDAQAAGTNEMRSVFDRPTAYTLRSLFVTPATKSSRVAVVGLKNRQLSKAPRTPTDVLGQQFVGGGRMVKRLEQMFAKAGLISSGEFLAPGAGAKIDAYGNLSRGLIAQIAAQLKLFTDSYQWSSKSKRSVMAAKKAGQMFWSRGGHLKRGVWMRDGRSAVKPILMVVSSPQYRPLLDLHAITTKVVADRFPQHWRNSFASALSSGGRA